MAKSVRQVSLKSEMFVAAQVVNRELLPAGIEFLAAKLEIELR